MIAFAESRVFGTKPIAGLVSMRSSSSCWGWAEIRTTRLRRPVAGLRRSATSNPLSSPSLMSTRMTSGSCSSAERIASAPVDATPTTVIPSRSSKERAAQRNSALSSTIMARTVTGIACPLDEAGHIAASGKRVPHRRPSGQELRTGPEDRSIAGSRRLFWPERERAQDVTETPGSGSCGRGARIGMCAREGGRGRENRPAIGKQLTCVLEQDDPVAQKAPPLLRMDGHDSRGHAIQSLRTRTVGHVLAHLVLRYRVRTSVTALLVVPRCLAKRC
jgi:hypothetical protein